VFNFPKGHPPVRDGRGSYAGINQTVLKPKVQPSNGTVPAPASASLPKNGQLWTVHQKK